MRFASRENTLVGQWEVGVGVVPGGGPMARLSRLVGRGRALEILLVADDLDGPRAEQYGYVNRLIADNQLNAEVEAIASRLARFDHDALMRTKSYVDELTLPDNSELGPAWDDFIELFRRPATLAQAARLLELGLNTDSEFERSLGRRLVECFPTPESGSGPETRQILHASILVIGGHTAAVRVGSPDHGRSGVQLVPKAASGRFGGYAGTRNRVGRWAKELL
jgi:enoyl-CoA hydratase/carnithine racemase